MGFQTIGISWYIVKIVLERGPIFYRIEYVVLTKKIIYFHEILAEFFLFKLVYVRVLIREIKKLKYH